MPSSPALSPTVSVVDVLPGRLVSCYSFYNPDYRHMEWGKYTALREIFWTQQVWWHSSLAGRLGVRNPLCASPTLSLLYWFVLRIPFGFLVVFEKPSRSSCTYTITCTWTLASISPPSPHAHTHPEQSQAMRQSPHLRFYDMCTYVHNCPRMSYKREYRPSQVMCPVLSHGQWVDLDAVAPLLDASKCVGHVLLIVTQCSVEPVPYVRLMHAPIGTLSLSLVIPASGRWRRRGGRSGYAPAARPIYRCR